MDIEAASRHALDRERRQPGAQRLQVARRHSSLVWCGTDEKANRTTDLAEARDEKLGLSGLAHSQEGLERSVQVGGGARRIRRDDRVRYPARGARCRHQTAPDLAANAPNPAKPLNPGGEAPGLHKAATPRSP